METEEINKLKKEIEIILNDNKAMEITSINSVATKKLNKKDFIYIKSRKINISSSIIRKYW